MRFARIQPQIEIFVKEVRASIRKIGSISSPKIVFSVAKEISHNNPEKSKEKSTRHGSC